MFGRPRFDSRKGVYDCLFHEHPPPVPWLTNYME